MDRQIWKFTIFWGLLLVLGGMLWMGIPACYGKEAEDAAQAVCQNPDTGYEVFVEDEAGLLLEDEIRELSEIMEKITKYGNAAFVTIEENYDSAEGFARSYYRERFGTDSGTVLVIDMDNRMLWIHSDGALYKVVTPSYANTVTDNVYRYASERDYFACAKEAFRQIYALLEGQRIAQPMKYISNALLALILALLANFGLVIGFTRLRKPGMNEVLANIHRSFRYTRPNASYTCQTKIYSPARSDSGSSGGGRSGGGGGSSSGGGSSGGGGGHRF